MTNVSRPAHIPNPCRISARSKIGDVPLPLAQMARVGSTRIAFARLRQLDRPLMTPRCTVGVHADRRRLTGVPRVRPGRGVRRALASGQPTSGRQDKSTAFGRAHTVGWIDVICWHIAPPCWRLRREHQRFQRTQRRRRSSCDQLASTSVAQRILRPFCSTTGWWHIAPHGLPACRRPSGRPAKEK